LFFGLSKPLALGNSSYEYPASMKFVREARQNPKCWIDVEKPFWWDLPVWLASGQVDSIGLANNHMCRDSMYESEAWGKPRDTKRLPPPRGNGFWSQEIYYDVLNSGLCIPPSAGSASGVLPNPVGYDRVYVHVGPKMSYEQWWAGLKAGRCFVTNGPLLMVRANDELPGHIFTAAEGEKLTIHIEASVLSEDPIPALEIVKDGEVAKRIAIHSLPCNEEATLTFDRSGWFLVRAVTNVPNTFRFASTAPYYVEIGPSKRRVSRKSVQFFLDWLDERIASLSKELTDPDQLREVLGHQRDARKFWERKLSEANAP